MSSFNSQTLTALGALVMVGIWLLIMTVLFGVVWLGLFLFTGPTPFLEALGLWLIMVVGAVLMRVR